jgi:hypothetical protein
VALFSDIDWLIILAVGAFLLFGERGGATVRQLGRWYGRAMRLKQELVGEVAKAADLPLPAGAPSGSLRAALLGLDAPRGAAVGIPAAVRTPPVGPSAPESPVPLPWTGGSPVTSWSTTYVTPVDGSRGSR